MVIMIIITLLPPQRSPPRPPPHPPPHSNNHFNNSPSQINHNHHHHHHHPNYAQKLISNPKPLFDNIKNARHVRRPFIDQKIKAAIISNALCVVKISAIYAGIPIIKGAIMLIASLITSPI
jgi:hypothetical protein